MRKNKKGKGTAIASLVLGIISIFTVFLAFGFILAIIAVVLGILVLKKKKPGKNLAIAGIVTGGIGIFLGLLTLIGSIIATILLKQLATGMTIFPF